MSPGPRGTVWLVLVAGILLPALYWGMFAGDAIIHLAYAEHAARGHFYEFNAGEISSGVTSPGYFLLLTAAYALVPAAIVPLVAKIAGIVSWLSLLVVVLATARRLLPGEGVAPVMCALILALMPGAAYNATIGMENGVFALIVWSALLLGIERPGEAIAAARRWSISGLWAASAWIRPEGVWVAALWYLTRTARSPRSSSNRWRPWVPGAIACGLAAAGAVAFQYAWTGDLIAASARSRVWMSALEGYALGPLHADPKAATRLIAYAPLTVGAVAATIALHRSRAQHAVWLPLVLTFWSGIAFYTFVAGGAHLARYTIFLMPALCLLAVRGWIFILSARPFGNRRRLRTATVCALIGALAIVYAVEARARRALGSGAMLRAAIEAPARRTKVTGEWLRQVNAGDGPVSVALVEVQLRYFVDDRVIVRSLDGRTDARLLDFTSPRGVDHAAYLRARGVDMVLEFPPWPDDAGWSLADLRALPVGIRASHRGLTFVRFGASDAVRVVPAGR